LINIPIAETGVAVVAEVISDGKVLDTGVDSLPSLGLVVAGMLKNRDVKQVVELICLCDRRVQTVSLGQAGSSENRRGSTVRK
jgi:hypothetical protein